MQSESHLAVRFAPSPTGRFHLGNLRTALISEAWARALGAEWVVRFEDIDSPRVIEHAFGEQTEDMLALGLVPGRIYRQSERRARHWELFVAGVKEGRVYPCFCSRKEVRDALAAHASAPHGEQTLYSGRCRAGGTASDVDLPTVAWRFRSRRGQGEYDFIVARTARPEIDEGSFAPSYHWACAIDDYDGNYTLLVRAWDLAQAADIQRALQGWLAERAGRAESFPAIFHTALVTQNGGARLEKRTRGVTLPELADSGISAPEVRRRLEATFHVDATEFSPGRIFGENQKELRLGELGF